MLPAEAVGPAVPGAPRAERGPGEVRGRGGVGAEGSWKSWSPRPVPAPAAHTQGGGEAAAAASRSMEPPPRGGPGRLGPTVRRARSPPRAPGAAGGVRWGRAPGRPDRAAPLRRARRCLPRRLPSASSARVRLGDFSSEGGPEPSGGCRGTAGGAPPPFGPVWGGSRGALPSRPRHRLLGRDSKRKGI